MKVISNQTIDEVKYLLGKVPEDVLTNEVLTRHNMGAISDEDFAECDRLIKNHRKK